MNNIFSGIEYFFRITEDVNYTQDSFLTIACIVVCVAVYIIAIKGDLKKINTTFARVLGGILLLFQLFVTVWFMRIRTDILADSLPLYFCRMSSFVIGYALLTNKIDGKFTNFFASFSSLGAALALFVPDMERYNFPHFTNFSFILIHGLLLFESIYVVKRSKTVLSERRTINITMMVIIPIHIFNMIFHTNYSYTVDLPSVLSVIPRQMAVVFVIISTFIVVNVVQKIKLRILKNRDINLNRLQTLK